MVACRARFAGNSGAIAKNCNAAAAAQEQPNVEIILTRVLRRQIDAFEHHYHYDMGYAHRMLRASLGAFLRFAMFSRCAQVRQGISAAPWFAARIAAALYEDCGPCTQLVVRMAEEAGVEGATLRAIVTDDEASLDPDTRLALSFAQAVLTQAPDCAALHDEAVLRWGERGVVSLALIIANTRVYPTRKRALGYAHACSRVEVGGQNIAPQLFTARA